MLAFVDARAGATDIVVVAVASGLIIARLAISGQGATCYGCLGADELDFDAAIELAFAGAVDARAGVADTDAAGDAAVFVLALAALSVLSRR
jgi:hypothetical protein